MNVPHTGRKTTSAECTLGNILCTIGHNFLSPNREIPLLLQIPPLSSYTEQIQYGKQYEVIEKMLQLAHFALHITYRLEEQIKLLLLDFLPLCIVWLALLPSSLCFCMSCFATVCCTCPTYRQGNLYVEGQDMDMSDGSQLEVPRFMGSTDTATETKCHSDPCLVKYPFL